MFSLISRVVDSLRATRSSWLLTCASPDRELTTRLQDRQHGPGDGALGGADLGVVGEVAGEADRCLGHGVPVPVAWPGGLPCPWNRGTVDTVACHQATRGKR